MPSNIQLVQLHESHLPILYKWKCSEKTPEYYTCRPVQNIIPSFEEYSEKILARISSADTVDMAVIDGDSMELLGHIFGFDINPRNKSIEIGYYFPEQSRRKGYGRAALAQLCNNLFTNHDINKIYATTGEFNKPSIAVLEHCNFHMDGRNREHYWIDDQRYDQLIFSLLREEWVQKRGTLLSGGNMNSPMLKQNRIYKSATESSSTIHRLLRHLERKGITWVPQSYGIEDGSHILSYIEGTTADEEQWLWNEELLREIAQRMREYHDATVDFKIVPKDIFFQVLQEPHEVICHNDFAPYNCIFKDQQFIGLIDFDVCSPGSRIWDLAYTAYRFIPLYPTEIVHNNPASPFTLEEMICRLSIFIKAYAGMKTELCYPLKAIVKKTVERLSSLATWTDSFAEESGKTELHGHAAMYRDRAEWLQKYFIAGMVE